MAVPLRVLCAVILTSVLMLTAGACATSDPPEAPERRAASDGDMERWKNGGWKDWDAATWARKAIDFINPVIDGIWDGDRMRAAIGSGKTATASVPADADAGVSDPEPAPVKAAAQETPYSATAPGIGKIFFDTPQGPAVCSGTVVRDPANPGRSNLVWTAGHCVHAGREGGWFRNIVFAPSFNSSGGPAPLFDFPTPERSSTTFPLGTWWVDWAQTSQQWIDTGTETGGNGSPFDFAVMHVKPPPGNSRSLEETAGSAVPVDFDAPLAASRVPITAFGYPAAAPFDGNRIFRCQDRSSRLSIQSDQPTLYRIGCTMTGGASGGGWFRRDERGAVVLISNTSIGPSPAGWLAGPRLGAEAKLVYTAVSSRFSGRPALPDSSAGKRR